MKPEKRLAKAYVNPRAQRAVIELWALWRHMNLKDTRYAKMGRKVKQM